MEQNAYKGRVTLIKNIYLYLVSFVALMMTVFSIADLLNVVLRTYVFKNADYFYPYYPGAECSAALGKRVPGVDESQVKPLTKEECEALKKEHEENQKRERLANRDRSLVRDISMIVVGMPLFVSHWWYVRKREEKE